MTDDRQSIEFLAMLVARLERLSVDSRFARRASGLRGNMIKLLEEADSGEPIAAKRLNLLVNAAFEILRQAAHEIPNLEALSEKTK